MKYFKIGPFFCKFGFDLQGHWITNHKNHKNMLWLWIGPSYEDDLVVYNFILGPIGFAFAKA